MKLIRQKLGLGTEATSAKPSAQPATAKSPAASKPATTPAKPSATTTSAKSPAVKSPAPAKPSAGAGNKTGSTEKTGVHYVMRFFVRSWWIAQL